MTWLTRDGDGLSSSSMVVVDVEARGRSFVGMHSSELRRCARGEKKTAELFEVDLAGAAEGLPVQRSVVPEITVGRRSMVRRRWTPGSCASLGGLMHHSFEWFQNNNNRG